MNFKFKKSHPKHDLSGQTFGRWQVIGFAGSRRKPSGASVRFWLCRCECGNQREVRTDQLVRGVAQSCGCLQREIARTTMTKPEVQQRKREREQFRAGRIAKGHPVIHNFRDLSGKQFGRLTVMRLSAIDNERSQWLCQCTCGNTTTVDASKLNNGHTRSCGCLEQENLAVGMRGGLSRITHGHARGGKPSPTYASWTNMKRRCLDENHHKYPDYGGRGIQICERWINSFADFLTDMGERPHGTTLNRINNDGNYEPSNSAWSTAKEQMNNRRNSKRKNETPDN